MSEATLTLGSTLTCPHCGTAKTETMPTDACQYLYDCTGCGTVLKPKAGHVVRLASGVAVNALCAIDALGTGAMLGCDTVIESPSRRCGEPVRLATYDSGNALRRVAPSTAVVWSGIRYADDCSATSGCTAKAFFCSDRHLAAWRERTESGGTGFRLSIEAALQIGKAIFVPMLAGPATNLTKLQEDPNR